MTSGLVALAVAVGLIPSGNLHAMSVARETWGTPACGTPRVETHTPAQYRRLHGTGYFEVEPDAWADESRCAIVINPRFKIRTAAKRCHIIVHEWGHLAGRSHSDNYRSVMYGDSSVVSEATLIDGKRRVATAAGAFKPCYGAGTTR